MLNYIAFLLGKSYSFFHQTWFRRLSAALLISIALLALLLPALLNGYPLLSQDSATHLYSGKQGFLPVDRPYYYGFFIRQISMNASLWLPVIVQAFFVYGIILLFIRKYLGMPALKSILTTTLLILVLCGTTSLAVFTSYLLPDVFAGIGVLGVILLLGPPNTPLETVFLGGTVLFSASVHLSHVPLLSFTAFCCIFLGAWKTNWMRRLFKSSILILCIWLIIPTLNLIIFQKFVLSESSYVFLTARISQTGILKEFQEKHPLLVPKELVLEKEQIPLSALTFLWNPSSPLYKNCPLPAKQTENEPAYTCFRYKNRIYKTLLNDMLSDRIIFQRLAWVSLISWKDQLSSFHITDLLMRDSKHSPGSELCKMVKFIYPAELGQFQQSAQFNREMDYGIMNRLFFWNVLGGTFVLLISLGWKYPSRALVCILLLSISVNAALCGCLSDVSDRYQARILWLIPLLVFLSGYELLRPLYLNRNTHVSTVESSRKSVVPPKEY